MDRVGVSRKIEYQPHRFVVSDAAAFPASRGSPTLGRSLKRQLIASVWVRDDPLSFQAASHSSPKIDNTTFAIVLVQIA
jgi:hypothetical protein